MTYAENIRQNILGLTDLFSQGVNGEIEDLTTPLPTLDPGIKIGGFTPILNSTSDHLRFMARGRLEDQLRPLSRYIKSLPRPSATEIVDRISLTLVTMSQLKGDAIQDEYVMMLRSVSSDLNRLAGLYE